MDISRRLTGSKQVPRRLCTICARGGSKRVPGKNIRSLHGKPLIAHTIEQAKSTGLFEAVVVDSDSDRILDVASDFGADHVLKRPADLATDEAAKIPVIQRAYIEGANLVGGEFDILVDLDATSPLRLVSDIVDAVAMLEASDAPNLITGAPARRSPYFNLVELKPDGAVGLCKQSDIEYVRGQDVPTCYDMNGSIYIWRTGTFMDDPRLFYKDTMIYVMSEERSIDIDHEDDFTYVSFLLDQRKT